MDWSAIDLSGITDGVTSALPVIIPVAIGIIGIGVVWKVIKKFVKSA